MKRRRRVHDLTPSYQWQADRDFELDRAIRTGLGIRPLDWWQHDSGRPDLAEGAGLDAYAHLLPREWEEMAAERLRFLAGNRLLTDAEWRAIHAAGPTRAPGLSYFQARSWRLAVLTEFEEMR